MLLNTDIKSLLSDCLIQKVLSERFLTFVSQEGIFEIFKTIHSFKIEQAMEAFEKKLGYNLQDKKRYRMAMIIIVFLCECGYMSKKDDLYTWNGNKDLERLPKDYRKKAEIAFKGQIDFFEKCMTYANGFLKEKSPLYKFDIDSTQNWEEFLGNAEFRFAREVLLKLLFSERNDNYEILDLCCGPGFDVLQMQEHCPQISITAIDFTDVFQVQASRRIHNNKSVKWISSKLWHGFGNRLPFGDNTFDIVFFACADPYIPEKLREYVYKDIFRILKKGGRLGILTRTYPDTEGTHVTDVWIRRGILCHDFAESVCEGWQGFYDAQESVNLFRRIGYNIYNVMLDGAVWRLDKP